MSDVKAVLLNSGKNLITGNLTGFTALGPTEFRIGNQAGFVPLKTETGPRGAMVFAGKSGLIQSRRLAEDTVRYTMTITEKYGPFDIGNIVMYASHADGMQRALFMVVLPFKVAKKVADPDAGSANPFPTPGSRFTINVTIKHSIEADDIIVEVIDPQFSSLPYFDTQFSVPPSITNPYATFVIHNDTRVNTPVLATKRGTGDYWGIPFFQNLRSPKFGVIDGGEMGDDHKEDQGSFAWGYFYLTPNDLLDGKIGGTGYIQDNDLGYVDVVGGVPY